MMKTRLCTFPGSHRRSDRHRTLGLPGGVPLELHGAQGRALLAQRGFRPRRGQHFNRDDGFVAEIAFGHYFLPMFAMELGAGYFESKASPAVPPGETKFKVVPVTLTGKVLFPIGPIEPYGEFGIGGYITEADVSGTVGNFSGSTKSVFGLHAGAGVNFNITQTIFLGVEGRYLWAKPSCGGTDIKLDGFTVTGNLGFRF